MKEPIERLLIAANKEANELAELLQEAADAIERLTAELDKTKALRHDCDGQLMASVAEHGHTKTLLGSANQQIFELTVERDAARNAALDEGIRAGAVAAERDALKSTAEQMYKRGWINAATWADRDDLIADIDSDAYEAELDAAIQGAKHEQKV